MNIKSKIKLFIPPIIVLIYKRLLKNDKAAFRLSGSHYNSWDQAIANSTGYNSKVILEKTKTALLKVKNGEAVYERDSVLFDHIEYSWPLLSGLMWVAAANGGTLNVLDYGGSLGSTYFQNRTFFSELKSVRCNIVEQPDHVKEGSKYF
jgi:putative methyltransferase (TIGR04325 family)